MKSITNFKFGKLGLLQIVLVTLILMVFSCKKDKTDYYALEKVKIAKYVADNNIQVEPKPSGLYYIEQKAGDVSADSARYGIVVSFRYRGYLLGDNGELTEFDNNINSTEPFEALIGASDAISGIEEGLIYMRMGGEATLIIPFDYAYGSLGKKDAQDNYVIPPYSTLIFYIELVNVQ
jgi:FKBP-type peptidyl-prolyl cis-trans isomerase